MSMHEIDVNSGIEQLWTLLDRQGDEQSPNRLVFVRDDDTISGIITDSDIRRFIAKNRRLPRRIDELVRADFVQIHESAIRSEMLTELQTQLSQRGWVQRAPILDVIVKLENDKYRLDPYSDYVNDLYKITDEYVVIGMGYIGLTLLSVLGFNGLKSVGIEKNQNRLKMLNQGIHYLHEPLLEDYVKNSNDIKFFQNIEDLNSTNFDKGIGRKWRRVYIVAVNTPLSFENEIDFSDLNEVIESISIDIQKGDCVILRSTLYVGGSEKIANDLSLLSGLICGIDFFLGFAPERTIEGNAITEIENLPQIVSGITPECLSRIELITRSWTANIVSASSCRAAELAKLSTNAFRDYHFAFANEIAIISESACVDVSEVINLSNKGYPRSFIPKPSPGVGGPCLSKDSHILLSSGDALKTGSFKLAHNSAILAARRLNANMAFFCVEKILKDLKDLECLDTHFHILGLAFKGEPETTDTRQSPSLEMIQHLRKHGYAPTVWDANIDINSMPNFKSLQVENKKNRITVIIGNNNKRNLEELFSILQSYNVSCIFDPWEMIKESGNLVKLNDRGINILNISNRHPKASA